VGETVRLLATTVEDTRGIGRAVAGLLRAGDVVELSGDLGAGKTAFVQGAAAGLGVGEPVTSPTFTLMREYQGTHRVYHLDVYRLDRVQDVLDLGFEELLDAEGVLFIEWGDVVEALLPESHLRVDLSLAAADGDERIVEVTAAGPSWAEREGRLHSALSPWANAMIEGPP
jgi:tRNA threonylcarbamoyladenosine biosynthesis protein TsaE